MNALQETTMQFTEAMQNMNAEKTRFEMQIEDQFQSIITQLMMRKNALLQDVYSEMLHKQTILSEKMNKFIAYQSELESIKQTCLLSLSDNNDFTVRDCHFYCYSCCRGQEE